jgi:tRNA modification GTPase
MLAADDTIAAIATAPGPAGIAVVRVSGPESIAIAERLFTGRRRPSACPGGTFLHGVIRSEHEPGRPVLDEVILLIYRAPHSYTRQDTIEIQAHGGRICAARILRAVLSAGARTAEAGEFTRRAFLGGRVDLVQAEAVADLIQSRSERAAQAAMEQLSGSLSNSIQILYNELIQIAADVAATLDFDEDALPEAVIPQIEERLSGCMHAVRSLLATWHEGRLLREGAIVVIAGPPNVGKSTLFNLLLGHHRAIVSPQAGTTRDTIEETTVLDGIPVRLVDTAGLRESGCEIESEGVRRARELLERADLILYLVDGSAKTIPPEVNADLKKIGARCSVLLTKSDLGSRISAQACGTDDALVCTFVDTRDIERVRERIRGELETNGDAPPHAVISERHRFQLVSVQTDLDEAINMIRTYGEEGAAIAATALKSALETLGSITGRVYSEDLLDTVFSRFCVGK